MPSRQTSYLRLYPYLHLGLRGLLRILAPRWRVTGRQHIPWRGPVIFTPNHISDCDPILIGTALRYPLWFMAKRELWEIPWLAPTLTYCQAFPVDPESADRSALKFAAELLERGEGLVVFPEGRISESGELDEILPGAVMLALKSGVPVVPVGLCGAQHLIPYGETRARFTWKRIHIHFGTPLEFGDLKELPGREARQIARERMAEGIKKARATAGR